MNKITPDFLLSPNEKTLNFIRQFARNYRAVKMVNGQYLDFTLG